MKNDKKFDEAINQNPAVQLFSETSSKTKEEKTEPEQSISEYLPPAPEGYRIDPRYIEKRTERLQLLVPKSMIDKIRKRAKTLKRSINDTCNELLSTALNN